jgi:hypothetical protein
MERWASIPSVPGYEVSDEANVRSLDRVIHCRASRRSTAFTQLWKGKLLSVFLVTKRGRSYRAVTIGGRKRKVAALMLEAFVEPKPFPSAQVRHLNDVSLDDRLDNLAWGTAKENKADQKRNRDLAAERRRQREGDGNGSTNPCE